MPRKPHPSSVLKTLPDDDQAALFEFLRTHKLAEGVDWLFSNNGVRTNDSSLSEWRGWYEMHRNINIWEGEVEELKGLLEKSGADPDLIPKLGEAVFLSKAARTGDVKAFATVAKITQRHVELKSKQQAHADNLEIKKKQSRQRDKQLELQAADLDRKNKELQSRLDELERQRKAAEEAITRANKDGGMTDETVKVIRQALGMKTDDA